MVIEKKITFSNYIKCVSNDYGLLSFHIGILLLFSAPSISAIFIIISLLIKRDLKRKIFYKDISNFTLLLASFFMFLSPLFFSLLNNQTALNYDYELFTRPYIGLLNWIPFFIFFSKAEIFLQNIQLRIYVGFFLICSVIPVLISGFSQEFFQIYGPKEILNGLIIWFQRPNASGMTGLFNNQNYTGCVIGSVLPIIIWFFYDSRKNFLNLATTFSILISFIVGLILTNSRNAWLSIPIVFCFLIFYKNKRINFLFLIKAFLIICFFNIFPLENKFFANLQFSNILNDPRIQIYKNSISYILKRPFLGWGGNGFSSIWNIDQTKDDFFGHSHNIFLELSIQYGLLTSLLITSVIFYLIYLNFRKLYVLRFKESDQNFIFDRAWFTSSIVIISSNLFDIPYYDFRISFLFWTFLAGLKVIAKEQVFNEKNKVKKIINKNN